ncbi:ABC transporter ATP-binding protein [Desulfocurvus sp.]|uniref:ABC transporter ATP-binding protein n=1 Tax=Desulfocurvus sp. TaxID=2871698 RepID=UPI0025C68ECB|nr:ABC transporter ATP-binding protein [Desulfocurvus sp.]MCK9239789.1 ABC transporter ATP-binding protein [Desulfocurvus sp.]
MAEPARNMVELVDVRLTLTGGAGPVEVLRGVDLAVEAGQTLSVAGPSGAGKTTMLMVMAGLERASSGRVVVDGQDLRALDEDGLARFRRGAVGVVFQAFHLVPTMTALENVALPLEFAGNPDAWDRARESLAAVGLEARAGHYPAELSGGEQQRVAIARAFAPGPRLLLADEPTGNLDEDTGARVADLLFDLRERRGVTLVLITHDMALAGRCSRTVHMHGGRLGQGQGPGA